MNFGMVYNSISGRQFHVMLVCVVSHAAIKISHLPMRTLCEPSTLIAQLVKQHVYVFM
jgi:hypothetical protein